MLDELRRDERRAEIVENAHRDVVASGRWTYRDFVASVLAVVPSPAGAPVPAVARVQDRLAWTWVALHQRVIMRAWLAALAAIPGPVKRPLQKLAMARAQRAAT